MANSSCSRRLGNILGVLLILTTVAACGLGGGGSGGGSDGTGNTDTGGGTSPPPLTFYESEVAGKWSRYHAYDGSTDYFIAKTDRTACEWTSPSGGGRTGQSNFSDWKLDEANPVADKRFRIMVTYADSGSVYSYGYYDYLTDVIWEGGYSNLIMYPSTTTQNC